MPDFLIEADSAAGQSLLGDQITGQNIVGDLVAEALSRVLQDPTATVYVAADLSPRDPVTGEIRRKLVTNAPRLHTAPGDSPPNAIHRALLMQGFSTERRLTAAGQFLGSSTYNAGTLLVLNDMGQTTDWGDLDWSNAAVVLRIGGAFQADGSPYPYGLYFPYFTGVVDSIDPDGSTDAAWTLTLVGRRKLLDQAAVQELYAGFGGGISVPISGGLTGTFPSLDVTGTGFTVEWFGRVEGVANAAIDLLAVTNGALSYGIAISSPQSLAVRTGAGSVGIWDFSLAQNLHVVMAVRPDGVTADLAIGVKGMPVVAAGTVTLLAPITNLSGTVNVGPRFPGFGALISSWEIRLWGNYQGLETIAARPEGPIVDLSAEPDLVEIWKFEDFFPPTAVGQLGRCNLTLSGTAAFIPSYEGDDPVVFPGGPAGKSKPDGWGVARSVALTNVDSQRHAYQWKRPSTGPSPDLLRAYLGGAPLVPDETIKLGTGRVYFALDDPHVITLSGIDFLTGLPMTGKRLVPGQLDPARTGQRITVTGSASNDATYTIAADLLGGQPAISADGTEIRVVESLISETAVSPASVLIHSLPADISYTYNLTNSVLITPKSLTGEATADVVLWLSQGGTARASEVMSQILGAPLDTSDLLWDPQVSFWLPPGSSLKTSEILDKVAFTAAAWWIETRDGTGYRMGTYLPPAGNPVAVIGGSRIAVAGIKEIKTIEPYFRFKVAYDPTWQPVTTFVGSVSQSQRDLLKNPWRYYPRTASAAFRARYPLSTERTDPFVTYLTNRADAAIWASYAEPLYMQKRRWLGLDVSGLSLLSVDLNDCVWVSHPDPRFKIVNGALCRILAMTEQTSSDLISMEVFR